MLELKYKDPRYWRKIWITSDPHYGHKNLVRGTSSWSNLNGTRNFISLEDHNQALIEGINDYVAKDDILICLGDWSFGGIDNIQKFRESINVDIVHLLLGNHDHHLRSNTNNVQSLFTSVNEKGILQVEKQMIVMDHFPQRVWWSSHKGTWMLFGHSHGSMDNTGYDEYKTMDVGVDTHPNFRPYSLLEIKDIMDQRKLIKIDHH